MSAEDLEIHQPTDVPVTKQYLVRDSVVDGRYNFMQKSEGILRSESLPYLMEVLTHHNEEDKADEAGPDAAT